MNTQIVPGDGSTGRRHFLGQEMMRETFVTAVINAPGHQRPDKITDSPGSITPSTVPTEPGVQLRWKIWEWSFGKHWVFQFAFNITAASQSCSPELLFSLLPLIKM